MVPMSEEDRMRMNKRTEIRATRGLIVILVLGVEEDSEEDSTTDEWRCDYFEIDGSRCMALAVRVDYTGRHWCADETHCA